MKNDFFISKWLINFKRDNHFFLIYIPLFILLFYGVLAFLFDTNTINPETPLWIKISKDIIMFFCFIFIFTLTKNEIFKDKKFLAYFLFVFFLSLGQILIAFKNLSFDTRLLGILKNFVFYYFFSGIFMLFLYLKKYKNIFFQANTILISINIVLGLYLMFFSGTPIENKYTMAGRLIGALSNPNYMAFFSSFLFFCALVIFNSYPAKYILCIFFSIISALGLAFSLSFTIWVCHIFSMFFLFLMFVIHRRKLVGRYLFLCCLNLLILFACLRVNIDKNNIFNIALREKGIVNFSSEKLYSLNTVQNRIMQWETVNQAGSLEKDHDNNKYPREIFSKEDGLSALEIEKDTNNYPKKKFYKEYDSFYINVYSNFGFIFVLGWFFWFITPVIIFFRSCKDKVFNKTIIFGEILVLVAYWLPLVFFGFSMQYYPEKFPMAFFIGVIPMYIFFNGLNRKMEF